MQKKKRFQLLIQKLHKKNHFQESVFYTFHLWRGRPPHLDLSHPERRLLVSESWQRLALLTHLRVHHEGTTLLSVLPLPNNQVELGRKKPYCGCPLQSPGGKKNQIRERLLWIDNSWGGWERYLLPGRVCSSAGRATCTSGPGRRGWRKASRGGRAGARTWDEELQRDCSQPDRDPDGWRGDSVRRWCEKTFACVHVIKTLTIMHCVWQRGFMAESTALGTG